MRVRQIEFMLGYYIRTKLLEALGVKLVATATVSAQQTREQFPHKTNFELGTRPNDFSGAGTIWASGDRRTMTAGKSYGLT